MTTVWRDAGRLTGFRTGPNGIATMIAAPPARRSLSHQVTPPCASTMVRLMASPIPMPFGFVVTNGAKIASSFSSGTPGPVSRTVSSAVCCAARDVSMPRVAPSEASARPPRAR